ncbi:TMAO reductase system periplasmic protein TorT [Marivita sp. S0852]|uniref:TMAO reductase system periplasmic protein TorT n=1 Tax=Marivita sp. S0852 TaxID=3373893 RepID=UPI003982B19C
MSKLVRRIVQQYGAAFAGTMIAVGLCATILITSANAQKTRLICVLVPHFKDEYWLSVGYGLEQEAARQDISLLFFEAGGYRARATQIAQLDTCVDRGADGILIGAVTSDHPELTDAIARVARTTPVFGLVNALKSPELSGRIGVDWTDMGRVLGEYLGQMHPTGTAVQTAVFLTGPKEAGWTGPLEQGLRQGLANSAVKILDVFAADTGVRAQLDQLERAISQYPDVDYIIGNAPAIETAFGFLAAQNMPDPPALLSTYVNHSVRRGLENGSVLAAAFDNPMEQGILAIRSLSLSNSRTEDDRVTEPIVELLTHSDSSFDHVRTSPSDYFPTLR